MSVILGQEVLAAGRSAEMVLAGHVGFGIAAFTAGLARSLGQGVWRRPLAEEPAHAEVFGPKTAAVKKALYRHATWVMLPTKST
jgi:hypothetical protein